VNARFELSRVIGERPTPDEPSASAPVDTKRCGPIIGICTADAARSAAFYQALGFSEAYTNDRGVMMTAGNVWLFLFATRQPDPPPLVRDVGMFGYPTGTEHISIAVTNVDALYARLREAGVACDGPPEDESWGARMVGLKDPDGNNLYLLQRF